jgi:uncharacterized SAM-binding protein YcdF (DUF218 family)
MDFLYSLLLKCFYPTSVCVLLLLASVIFRKRKIPCRVLFWSAWGVLMICGNGLVAGWMAAGLEKQYPSATPLPIADAIVILSGGLEDRIPPRTGIEVSEAGDRVLHAWRLFRDGLAPRVICTGGTGTGGAEGTPAAEVISQFLQELGVPENAITVEKLAKDTHEHAVNLGPVFTGGGIHQVLLVTSAMHMPRAVASFRKSCPGINFIPAPCDFRVVAGPPQPWYRSLAAFIPTPSQLSVFTDAAHEYLGLVKYYFKGWI